MKVLHIFSPNYKKRFGGQVFLWKKIFQNWKGGRIENVVFDFDKNSVLDAKSAFQFSYPKKQIPNNIISNSCSFFELFIFLCFHKNEFNVVHVHVLRWGGLLLGLLTKSLRIPSIYESVLLNSDNPSNIEKQRFGTIKKALLKSYSGIIAISPFLAEDFRLHGFNVYELINPVDSHQFAPPKSVDDIKNLRVKFKIPENAFVWLNVGTVRFRKGTDILIKGFIEHSIRNKNDYLIIIGPQSVDENPSISPDFVSDLKKQLDQNGVLDKVRFVGLIQDSGIVAQYYKLADVFVFPSRDEGLGNVVLEAMASSLPVVVSDLPVLEKIIDNNHNGIVLESNQPSEISNAISKIKENNIFSKSLGRMAREFVINNNDVYTWQKNLFEVYSKVVKNNE